jgi:hypothetical protein
MAIPDMNTLIKQLVARSLVIGGLSYFLLDNHVVPGTLMEHLQVGAVGAGGSIISQCYVENM